MDSASILHGIRLDAKQVIMELFLPANLSTSIDETKYNRKKTTKMPILTLKTNNVLNLGFKKTETYI